MFNKENHTGENVITVQKIWENMKRFWWFCAIPVILCLIMVYQGTMQTYRTNQAAAAKDTYIASALVYYPTPDEETGKGNMVIFQSSSTMEKVNQILEENNYSPFDENTDSLELGHTMGSYGITLIGEGEERMLCMGQAFAESMLDVMEEATGVRGYIVDSAYVEPCMIDASGNTIIYSDISQKQVTLSLSNFVTWRNMMIICAGIFLGMALIFVAILFDKKIRSREEMEELCSFPCIGAMKKKNGMGKELCISLILAMCDEGKINQLTLVSASTENQLNGLAAQLSAESKGNLRVECGENAVDSVDTLNKCRGSQGVVFTVRKNKDDVNSIRRIQRNMEMLQAQVLGYVFID